MANRDVLWGRDLDESPADFDDDYHSNGHHEPTTEPIPIVEPEYHADFGYNADSDYDVAPDYREEFDRPVSFARPFIDRTPGTPIGSLTFKSAAPPWYRTRPAFIALLAVVAATVVLAIIPLVLRDSGAAPDESTGVTPTSTVPSPSVAPSTTGAQPSLSSRPAPPPPLPPPPPPPPPPPAENNAPVYTRQYSPPRYSSPPEQKKPEIDVTRAPISVAPKPVTPHKTAEPGHGNGGGGFFG